MKLQHLSPAQRAVFWGTLAGTTYGAMIFGPLAKLQDIAQLAPLDLRPWGYARADVSALMTALGAQGRALYLQWQLLLDTAYPVLLALTLGNLLHWAAGPRVLTRTGLWLAWLAALCDYGENAAIAAMLGLWPDLPATLARLASALTQAKSALTCLCITLTLGLLIWRCLHHRRKKSDTRTKD